MGHTTPQWIETAGKGTRLDLCELYIRSVCELCPSAPSTCPWLSTGYLLLDLYHSRLTQDLHTGLWPPSSRQSAKGSANAVEC